KPAQSMATESAEVVGRGLAITRVGGVQMLRERRVSVFGVVVATALIGSLWATSVQASDIVLSATIRDFCGLGYTGCADGNGGLGNIAPHPDFEPTLAGGFNIYTGEVQNTLGGDGKLVYATPAT